MNIVHEFICRVYLYWLLVIPQKVATTACFIQKESPFFPQSWLT
jgi:hypothetical protein